MKEQKKERIKNESIKDKREGLMWKELTAVVGT